MRRTIAIYVEPDPVLLKTIETVNNMTNDIMKIGFDSKIFNKLRLHHLTYYPMREKYPGVQASLVTTARDTASEMLKREKLKVLPKKRLHSAIRYNMRTLVVKMNKGFISMSTIESRKHIQFVVPKCFKKYADWKIQSATVRFDSHRNKVIISLCAEQRTPSVRPASTVLGVDTGILNHAVLSNNKFFNSNEIHNIKGRYQYIKRQLQAKGTRSAKRHLKWLSGREKRFMADVNHCVANWIVDQPFDSIAMEQLDVKRNKKLGKRFNRMLGGWAFGQLQKFVEYKAETVGKSVYYIDARYTSQRCSKCGTVKKSNRQGLRYKCKECGFELHSDLNASRNIAKLGRTELSRLSVNQPIVTGSDVQGTDSSYKPPNSLGGS